MGSQETMTKGNSNHQLSDYPIIQLSNYPIIQLSNYSIIQLSNYSIIQLFIQIGNQKVFHKNSFGSNYKSEKRKEKKQG